MGTKAATPIKETLVGEAVQHIRQVVKAIEDYSREVGHRFGLTGPQVRALWELGMDGPPTHKHLAGRVDMDPSTLVGVIDRLLVKGLVLKTKDPVDRRQVSLRPSAKGWAILSAAPHPAHGMLPRGLQRMEHTELRRLNHSLRKLAAILEEERLESRVGSHAKPQPT
jgi:DNA-binding MarR family transcriptional regulator